MDFPSLAAGARPGLRSDVSTDVVKRWDPALRASSEGDATVTILDRIGADVWGDGVTAKRIGAALRGIGARPVTVQINSPGGDVFEGGAIYEMLRQHSRERGRVTVQILGLAASAASIIAMAGDEILIGRSAFVMIHNSWVVAAGDRHAFQEVSTWLEPFDAAMADVYSARTGADRNEIVKMMDRETWLNAARCEELGFADGALDADAVAIGSDPDTSAALRAEKRFDLIAAKAGVSRSDAREILRDVKGGPRDAAATGAPGAAEIEGELQAILTILKS